MEFKKAMEIMRRICNNVGVNCDKCPLFLDNNCSTRPWVDSDVEQVEGILDKWDKTHPEPQYETWAGLLYRDFLIWCQEKYPGRAKDEKAWFDYIYETRIPADIAEKLGIEPKEANGDET